ncbi:MAG TPA: hypothetical protein VK023_01565, partial [Sphingobacterium bovisgrunnientis]|nr:hypothetical protein [Sphingobacterium bovisgrunnientis]
MKSQLISSSIISLLIMLFGASYLFYSLNVFTNKNEEILSNTQEKLYISTSINTHIKELIHANMDEARTPNSQKQNIRNIATELETETAKLEEAKDGNEYILPLKLHTKDLIKSSLNPIYTDKDELIAYWTTQDQKTLNVVNTFIKNVVEHRVAEMEQNERSFNIAKIVIVVLITLIIIFIIFTFYKVIQTLQKLKETTDN